MSRAEDISGFGGGPRLFATKKQFGDKLPTVPEAVMEEELPSIPEEITPTFDMDQMEIKAKQRKQLAVRKYKRNSNKLFLEATGYNLRMGHERIATQMMLSDDCQLGTKAFFPTNPRNKRLNKHESYREKYKAAMGLFHAKLSQERQSPGP